MTPYSGELYGVEFLCVLFGIREPPQRVCGGVSGFTTVVKINV